MTDDLSNRTDHAEEARAMLAYAESYGSDARRFLGDGALERARAALDRSLIAATRAQVHATLAVAEQLRLANLFQSGAIGGGPVNDHIPGEVQSYLRREWPDVAATLGVARWLPNSRGK